MKRVIVDHYGGPEVLQVVEADDPRPGPGEVRVKVLAAGVSFTDAQLRAGTYIPGGPKPPFTPGYELVGVVDALGPACTRLRAGDRIGAGTRTGRR
jgi:NADPH:quinone reductase